MSQMFWECIVAVGTFRTLIIVLYKLVVVAEPETNNWDGTKEGHKRGEGGADKTILRQILVWSTRF